MEGPDSPEWVGKAAQDIYGRNLGRVVGIVFDVSGKVKSVGIKGRDALMTIHTEQVTSAERELVVIPQSKLESKHVGLERGVLMKQVSASEATDEDRTSASSAEEKTEVLGQQVSEWVFAKRVDLEALDIMSGDCRPLKSLEKKSSPPPGASLFGHRERGRASLCVWPPRTFCA